MQRLRLPLWRPEAASAAALPACTARKDAGSGPSLNRSQAASERTGGALGC